MVALAVSPRFTKVCLANCYFAHDSSGFPTLLLFFDARSGRSCYPVLRQNFIRVENNESNQKPSTKVPDLRQEQLCLRTDFLCRGSSSASHLYIKDGQPSFPQHEVGIRRLDRSDGAVRQAVGKTRSDRKPLREFSRQVFASPGQGACGLRDHSGRIRKEAFSDGVH